MESLLAPQSFASNALNRSTLGRRDPDFLKQVLPESLLLLVAGRSVCVRSSKEQGTAQLGWFSASGLGRLHLQCRQGTFAYAAGDHNNAVDLLPYLLGQDDSSGEWKLALDVTSVAEVSQALLGEGLTMQDLRSLMPQLSEGDLAVAGQAVALSQWHQTHMFCGRCGSLTVPIEAGAKRQCNKDSSHRAYPRTDPVAIMFVESVDGSSALLGGSKKGRPGMYTCLSGFIEQGESIEEAVRREVREEAGVATGAVQIIGSQPWPIGRGGSCELMIGCMAKALDDSLRVDFTEMIDVRWIKKDEVKRALEATLDPNNPYLGGKGSSEGFNFWIPPPIAIAHHLIKAWAERPDPWFPSRL